MHVAVEAIAITRNLRGMGRYARSLLAALPRERPDIRFSMFARNDGDIGPLTEQLASLPGVMERTVVRPAREMAEVECDVAWYPCNFVNHLPRRGAIMPTVHDIFPMLQLDGRWWKVVKRARATWRYRRAVTRADHVITVSELSASELVRHFDIARNNISVVPHGADDFRVADRACADALLARLNVRGPFLLAVSSQEPRKNLGVLYRAMASLAERGEHIPLVLCGPKGVHGYRAGDATPSWLRQAGFVTDTELAALYARATALVFPSLHEGFGLPVLEAMTVGGVVISADASTMPEVGGDAALYFPPNDAAALAGQVTRLVGDPELSVTLREASVRQAAKFSWAASARGTITGFERAIAAHHP